MPNDVKLQEGHPVDENLRPIKVGGKSTAIETAQHGNGARVNGDLEVTGDIKGNIKDMVLEDVTLDSLTTNSIVSTNLTIDDSHDITLDAGGGDVNILQADLNIPIDKKVILGGESEYITGDDTDISIKAAGHILVTPAGDSSSLKIFAGATEVIKLNTAEGGAGGSIRLNSIADTGDYCKLKTTTAGVTTLETVDDDGEEADLTLNIDGKVDINSATGEDITLDSGNDIILDIGATSDNINFKVGGVNAGKIYTSSSLTKLMGDTVNHVIELESAGTGDIVLDSNGDIDISSNDGNFIMRKGDTEFSAANSAYAGMILGYTRLEGDLTSQSTFEIQNAMTVEDDTHQITFKTPPSELVEIEATFLINRFSSTDTKICVGISDQDAGDGYQSIGEQYEYDTSGISFSDDEVDDSVCVVKWVLPAAELVAIGSSNTFWIGFSTGGITKTAYLAYGLRATHGLTEHPFIIKATALPAVIYDGQ